MSENSQTLWSVDTVRDPADRKVGGDLPFYTFMNNFWNDLPKPFFALAPMESVTDTVFRHVIASAAKPDLFFTEFTNASSFCSEKGKVSTANRLAFSNDERPIVAQIWGNKPDEFAKMSIELAQMGFDGIDINMGCPDKAVVKTGSGSALIRTPELASKLIQSAKSSGLPVSVKTRLGYSNINEWQQWLGFLFNQDLANLTIHLRTCREMSKVDSHYELIDDIVKMRDSIAPKTLLTINGDIRDRQHGGILANKHNVDGIMIGRGVFQNPFTFEKENKKHDKHELLELLKLHLDLFDKSISCQGGILGERSRQKFDPLKRFFKIYINNFPGAVELRTKLMLAKNTGEVRDIITAID